MSGTGLQFGRVRGDDRFYIPVRARKNQGGQNHLQKQGAGKTRNGQNQRLDSSSKKNSVPCENGISKEPDEESPNKAPVVSPSNLDRFLESTIPSVPAQYFSKTTLKGWRTTDVEFQPYFALDDLWESFKQWSVYGAGVPLVLDGIDSVVQYYVPYLSGIQLYGPTPNSNPKPRSSSEDSDGDYCSSSDGSSDYEIEKGLKFSGNLQHCRHPANEVSRRMGWLAVSDEQISGLESFSSDDNETRNSRGCLLFEYYEHDPPYCREPLSDKVMDLAHRFPALKNIRSCDLMPSSWVSVAWYPIYRIPTGPTLKDLDACFLTYHFLSTPLEGSGDARSPVIDYPPDMDGVPKIRLPIFGMASYKLKGSLWTQNGASEHLLANSLSQDAGNWLRLLGVNHPDFQFFASHGMYVR